MPLLIQYLVKLSISLAFVWLFYQLFLRKLTFYNSNRWYLLGYTLLSFFIPFINISPVLNSSGDSNRLVQLIPVVYKYTGALNDATSCPESLWSTNYNKWDWMSFALMAGVVFLLLRFIVRFISFLRMQRKAQLIYDNGVKLYQVDKKIIPFSFGNTVFINSNLHNGNELKEIIRHEFVHVKQKHTIDIVWAEMLCIFCWYNPFAWLLKTSIRQNLEFIADNKVLQNGFDKKQYQYLLLKVIGNNHFSIANQFNFSSLKKRIAMMNKIRSARVNLLRFLFILPLLAVILISFRQHQKAVKKNDQTVKVLTNVTDTIPDITEPNKKGYIINIKDNKGECTIVVKDESGKEVERLLLTKWNENKEHYENLYGKIPPPPPAPPAPPTPPGIPPPPPPAPGRNITEVNLSRVSDDFEITNESAVIKLKDHTIEKYDLTDAGQRSAFEKKYGEILNVNVSAPVSIKAVATVNTNADKVTVIPVTAIAPINMNVSTVVSESNTTVVAPTVAVEGSVSVLDDYGYVITGKEDIILTITKTTTRQQLDEFVKQMKEKGVTLSFDKIEYNSNGQLVTLNGTMKSKDGKSNFSASDFQQVILAMIKKGDRTYFKVNVKDDREVM